MATYKVTTGLVGMDYAYSSPDIYGSLNCQVMGSTIWRPYFVTSDLTKLSIVCNLDGCEFKCS